MRTAAAVTSTALSLALAGPVHATDGSAPAQAGPCASVAAPTGYVCVPAPKQCITTPCPQYDVVPLTSEPWWDV